MKEEKILEEKEYTENNTSFEEEFEDEFLDDNEDDGDNFLDNKDEKSTVIIEDEDM